MSRFSARFARIALCALACCVPRLARAEEPQSAHSLAWNPSWPKFRTSEYVLTGVAGAASISAFFLVKARSSPTWTHGILFDDDLRTALRLRSPTLRDDARTLSNWTAIANVVWAVAVDSAIPALHGRSDTATQLILMDAESFAFSTLVTTSIFKTVGRARPSYADCQRDPNFDPLCRSGATSSFPSGHTNAAFTAAGLGCAHHLHLALYGDSVADTLACAGMITVAGATGSLRMMGDRHYASDVLVGGLIGFAFGYGIPTAFHYGKASESTQSSLMVSPFGAGFPFGPEISGTF